MIFYFQMKSVYRLKYDSRNWFATEVMTERQKLALSRNVHCLLKDKDQLGRSVYLLRLGKYLCFYFNYFIFFKKTCFHFKLIKLVITVTSQNFKVVMEKIIG